MWEASLENAKQPPFGICDIRSTGLQVPSFPRACPRMRRREDWAEYPNLKYRKPNPGRGISETALQPRCAIRATPRGVRGALRASGTWGLTRRAPGRAREAGQ